jgi:phosphoadenosine phosphosulfate reductase
VRPDQMSLFDQRSLEEKVTDSIARIKAFVPPEGYYLAFSGGKDSIVLKRLVQISGVRYDAHYNATTIDPPELISFIKTHHPDVIWEWPKRGGMAQICQRKRMLPTRLTRFCCQELKEGGGNGRKVLTGVRWAESARRADNVKLVRPCMKQNKTTINPILDWCDEDVWAFIRNESIPYCELYDQGFSRLGCVGCPMAGPAGMAKEFVRWPGYLRMYYRIAERILPEIIARRAAKGTPTPIDTPRKFILWWIRDLTKDQRHASVVSRLIDEHCVRK